jgi:hypothetical protein
MDLVACLRQLFPSCRGWGSGITLFFDNRGITDKTDIFSGDWGTD